MKNINVCVDPNKEGEGEVSPINISCNSYTSKKFDIDMEHG